MKFILIILCASLLINNRIFAAATSWSSSLPKKTKFEVTPDLKSRVDFWVKIYTQYTTDQGLFHLIDDPSFVFGKIDLTRIMDNPNLTAYEKNKRSELLIENKRKQYAQKFKIDPKKIRLQMGLRERMRKALYLSGKYVDHMEEIFKNEDLPPELTRLVYVESSFNIFAQSKVGASGLWQIMPSVAKERRYIATDYDKRNHPLYATRLAAKILKQNYKSLMSWPLAITAYNHGLAGMKRMVRKNKTAQIEKLIESENVTSSWGFASKNFYPCFLAVLEVERNAVKYFGKGIIKAKPLDIVEYKLVAQTPKAKILKRFGGSMTRFQMMNPHLNWSALKKKNIIPSGVPLMVPSDKAIDIVRN